MIISRTPLRISFCGGGSDLKEFYKRHEGVVLSTSINKYIFLSLHPYFFGNKYFLKYSQSELVDDVAHIKHRIIKQVFQDYQINQVDFNSSADIPSGSGLGSSSAFTVGLANLCNAYTGRYASKEALAEYACQVEIEKLGEPIGKQDQFSCAVGGLNMIRFHPDETVSVEKVCISPQKRNYLKKNLLVFYTGRNRSASGILKEQRENTLKGGRRVKNLQKMVKLAHDLGKELSRGNIDEMGDILHTSWMYKRELARKISSGDIDAYYDLAVKNGASGGKLLGAGGGGFLLFYVKEYHQPMVRHALSGLKELDFQFDNDGSTIIYFE